MFKYIVLAVCWMSGPPLSGQQITFSVYGKVVESVTHDPLEFVHIFLKRFQDSTLIQNTVSDAEGGFIFNEVSPGEYFIEASQTGFEIKKTLGFDLEDNLNIGLLALTASDFMLDEIQVTASNPLFVHAVDRKIYQAGQDIQAQSGSVSDILQNIPSITVEAEGEILLRGSANITFLLNGKNSGLLKNNASAVLEQIPAHTIERIEIITNPSAKYKPDGTAGIINIVTKKNVVPGFNGSILANASSNTRYNGNISLNYNHGKFNLSVISGYRQNYSPRTFTDFRIATDTFSESTTIFDLRNKAIGKSRSYNSTFNFDYAPDEKNTLNASASFFSSNSERDNDITTIETDDSGILNDYTTTRVNEDDENELELSISAEHTFHKEDHAISLEAAYYKDTEVEVSRFSDIYRFPVYPVYDGHNNLNKKGDGTTLSLDYVNPLSESLELEAGYLGEYSSGDLDFYSEYFDVSDQTWKKDIQKTNRFLYRQDIHAVYGTLSKSIEEFNILVGLRAEQTDIESNLIAFDSVIPNHYFNLFPTLHLIYELGDNQEIGLSYSRRVNRPDPDELNPFPEYIDIRDIEAGNPYLKPEQIHSVELGYQFHNDHINFSPTLYFRNTYDAITEESHYINDSTLLTTLQNLDKENEGGLELIFSWSPTKKMYLNFSSNLFYHRIDASNLRDQQYTSIISADTKLVAFLNIFPNTKFQINATYRSAMLTSQGRSLPVYFLNAGLKQDVFMKKASLTLTVSDVFNTMKWEYIIDTPELYQKVSRKRKSQVIYLGFSYRFGLSAKKQQEELIFDDKI